MAILIPIISIVYFYLNYKQSNSSSIIESSNTESPIHIPGKAQKYPVIWLNDQNAKYGKEFMLYIFLDNKYYELGFVNVPKNEGMGLVVYRPASEQQLAQPNNIKFENRKKEP